ncbi:MAG: ATP-binding cassette domain-containing protein [bacterium]|nr:ATP-binding cassette domain-containing protein [bacterium]
MIEVRNVTKSFGPTVALNDVSFSLKQGEILGFLGPNGAGKSTAMKIITTFLAADSGSVRVDGIDVMADPLKVRSLIGYLPENNPLYVDMLVSEYLKFVGQARGLSGNQLKQRTEWVIESCGIKSVLHKSINELSKGYKQRTGLAQALIHDPEILILDEPTSGLDPLQIIGIRELIHSLAKKKTIIFSTHILQEVAPVTDRVVIINNGNIIADGMIDDLQKQAMETNRLFVTINSPDAGNGLSDLEGVESVIELGNNRFEVRAPFDLDLRNDIVALSHQNSWQLLEIQEALFSLEDTFIALNQNSGGKVVDYV